MKKQVEIALCVSAAVIALVVLFNLLPSGIGRPAPRFRIRQGATPLVAGLGAAAGAAAGWRAKMWYDRMKG